MLKIVFIMTGLGNLLLLSCILSAETPQLCFPLLNLP